MPPAVNRPQLAVFAGNHGVARHGVEGASTAATSALVEHCAAGGAAVSQLCVANEIGLKVYDLALDLPTGNITTEAALDERGAAATMAFGMEATAGGMDLLCVGSIGVAGSASSTAVLAALLGGGAEDWVRVEPGEEAEVAERGSRRSIGHWRRIAAGSTIPSKCCVGSADAKPRRSRARSWQPGRRRSR